MSDRLRGSFRRQGRCNVNPAYYVPILFLLLLVILNQQRERQIIQKQIVKKKKQRRKGNQAMIELAKEMVGKECLIYTFNGVQLSGRIAEIRENAVLLDNGKEKEIVNLDYVVRIREFPKNKKGKNKAVVLD